MASNTDSPIASNHQSEHLALLQIQARYERLLQLYAMLTHSNQAIVRCNSALELFNEVCKIAIEHGGMAMAWVGRLDESSQQIIPVACFGEGTEILEEIYVTADASDPRGQGPSGTAIRENQPFWCHDYTNDPRLAPWHEIVAAYKWQATATVPITQNGKPVAALSMYSHQSDAFDKTAQELMIRIGQDISHALNAYEREEERKHNEALLRGESLKSLSQRDAALREITQGVLIASADRVATYINDAFTKKTGYTKEEVLGKRCTLLHGAKTCPETIKCAREKLDANQPFRGEVLNYRKDGTTFWNDLTITPVFDDNGILTQWVGVQRDITQRKLDEEHITRLKNLYVALSHCNHAIVHSPNEQALFDLICKAAVEYGGFTQVWIGTKENDGLSAEAAFGKNETLVEELLRIANANKHWKSSPSRKAVETGKPIWCQNFLNDPDTAPWHEIAEQQGMRAMAALPLCKNGKVVGNFTLYADTVNAFDDATQQLLMEMAQDVSFALDNFEREAARKKAEEDLLLAANVFQQSKEAVSILDISHKVLMINTAFTKITGYKEDEVVGNNIWDFVPTDIKSDLYQTIMPALHETGAWEGKFWNKRKNGENFLECATARCIFNAEGQHTHYIHTFSDATEIETSKSRIHWLAHFDPLTGLPNRTLLEDRCQQAINKAAADNQSMALMFLDLDHFKNVNDTIGHRAGDRLLSELAKRLNEVTREQDTLSRLGGDDFVFILPGTDSEKAAHMAEWVLAAITQPFELQEHEVNISCSIGIAMYPHDGKDFDSLIQCADMAMFQAKDMGRNTFRFFTSGIQERLMRTLKLESALRLAMEKEQLSLHYQPQVDIESNEIIGVEALLRWQHPELGVVSPAEFIPVAENSGLILPIGDWVIQTAAKQLKTWLFNGYKPLIMSVNLSALQFRQPHFPEKVRRIIDEYHLPPALFQLELTESATMEDPKAAIKVMNELNQFGIRMSIDDFGTGYSSLAYLKRFQIHKLKIDQSFVRDILTDPDDRAIVDAVINLASSLGMKTIAEGVETIEQKIYLHGKGCDEFQGYYFSRPLPAEQVEPLLKKNH